MSIPVFVQPPNQPNKGRIVGNANETWTAERVARYVGVPDGTLVDGKIIRRRGGAFWNLVANVRLETRMEPT